MSDYDDDLDGDEELDNGGKKKKLIIIIAVFVLLLVGAGGYLGYAYLKSLPPFEPAGPSPEEIAAQRAAQEQALREQLQEGFIKYDTSFTVNMKSANGKSHVMQVEVCLVTIGVENEELANKHKALIASIISEVASNQQYDSLVTATGRQRLKQIMLETIRSKLSGITKKPVVEQVLFTNFVLQ